MAKPGGGHTEDSPNSSPATAAAFAGNTRFELVRHLGFGGYGTVHEAIDRERRARVALKVLNRTGEREVRRFKNEFRRLADLRHPNLVALHELYADEGAWFFTMELVHGDTFISHVRQAGDGEPLRARLAAALRQLSAGLLALHAAGMVHRDVKPSNMLVARDGRVVLLDFGLVLALGEAEQSGAGTPGYSSPEQMSGRPLTPASDWYSVGVMLHEAIWGAPPNAAPAPTTGAPAELRELAELAARLLVPRPSERPDGVALLRLLGEPPSLDRVELEVDDLTVIGREPELAALTRAFAAAQAGRPSVALLRGESGVGKTFLIDHFCRLVEREYPDARVLAGRCFEREYLPYKAFDGIIDRLAHRLGSLSPPALAALLPDDTSALVRQFPSLARLAGAAARAQPTDLQELRRRAFAALRELLRRLCRAAPLVIAVDDLQWSDSDSTLLFDELLRPPDAPAVLFVLAMRPGDGASEGFVPSADVLREPALVTHLRAAAAGSGERGAARAASPRQAGRRQRGARRGSRPRIGRNPLFIRELVRQAWIDGDALKGASKIERLLDRRLRDLGEPARELLALLAVFGRPMEERMMLDVTADRAAHDALVQLAGVAARLGAALGDGAPGGDRPQSRARGGVDVARARAAKELSRAAGAGAGASRR